MFFQSLFALQPSWKSPSDHPACLTSDQDPIQEDHISSICGTPTSILPHSTPFVCRGRAKDINKTSIDLTSLESPPWPHTCCLWAAGISSPSLLRMCTLENMRAAQGPQGWAACLEEMVKNVNLDITAVSTRIVRNAAIVFMKTGSSSLILSTCRLNIHAGLPGSIVLLLSLFQPNCGGSSVDVVVPGWDWLSLSLNTSFFPLIHVLFSPYP